jgi:hypothetical protein
MSDIVHFDNIQFQGTCWQSIQATCLHWKRPENSGTLYSTCFKQAELLQMTWQWPSPMEPGGWLPWCKQNSHMHKTKRGSPVCSVVQAMLGDPVSHPSKTENFSWNLGAPGKQSTYKTGKHICGKTLVYERGHQLYYKYQQPSTAKSGHASSHKRFSVTYSCLSNTLLSAWRILCYSYLGK